MTDRETIREAVSQALKLAEVPRRERIATAVMAGFAAGIPESERLAIPPSEEAVEWADALIAELDKGRP